MTGARAVVRTAFLLVFTVVAVIANGVDIIAPWHPYSTYGYSADQAGHVTAVDATAARAGLRVGEQIDIRRLSFSRRAVPNYIPLAPEGDRLRVYLTSGRAVTLVSHAFSRNTADNVTDILGIVAASLYIILAALLVLIRPMPSTWAFYAFSYTFCYFVSVELIEYFPLPLHVAVWLVALVASAVAPVAFLSFALRFPDAAPARGARLAERLLLFVAVPIFAAWNIASFVLYLTDAWLPSAWIGTAFTLAGFLIFGCGIAILFARYAAASVQSRVRLQWVAAGLAVAFLPTFVINVMTEALGLLPSILFINLAQTWIVIAPIAVAYTVLRHRLFDLRLVVSRALVYAIITSLMVGILALVDWAFGQWLAQSRFALVGELALALFLGFSLTTVHRRIENALNAIIFRAKAVALAALRRFTQEIDLIADPQRLMAQTFDALNKRLESEYVAIYTVDGAAYARATPAVEPTPSLLPNDDFAVLRLRRWSEPFECDEPGHPLRGALLLPMMARAQLVGFIVCGPKRDRTHYLPDEVETLSALAHRAGSAYAWLTMRPLDSGVMLAPEVSP